MAVSAAPGSLTARLAADLDTTFPDLVAAHQDGLFTGVRPLVPTMADAEDVVQETLIRAYRALGTWEPDRIRQMRLGPWLWTIALNLCRNAARSRARRPTTVGLDDRDEGRGSESADTALDELALDEWRERLGRLSRPMRTAVVLRHVVGLPYPDIAAATDRPIGTVKADVHRGLQRLRVMLEADQENTR
jgi:RNA polymerase sigma-70 factor (ECF subfamily)